VVPPPPQYALPATPPLYAHPPQYVPQPPEVPALWAPPSFVDLVSDDEEDGVAGN
jgi:hypothetical protein